MKLYLCGPMTNLPAFNFPAFDKAAAFLRDLGHEVVSPAELDSKRTRKAAVASTDGDWQAYEGRTGDGRGKLLGRDIRLVLDDAEGVVVLPGWRDSRGARVETYAAWLHDKPVFYMPTSDDFTPLIRVSEPALIAAWTTSGESA